MKYPVMNSEGTRYVMPPPDATWLDQQVTGLGEAEIWGVARNIMEHGYSGLGDMYSGPFPDGVPNPFVPMLHSYPTRYHGPIYTRPMYQLPWIERPDSFTVPVGMEGLGEETTPEPVLVDEPAPTPVLASVPPPWKFAVALSLAGLTVWAAMKYADQAART